MAIKQRFPHTSESITKRSYNAGLYVCLPRTLPPRHGGCRCACTSLGYADPGGAPAGYRITMTTISVTCLPPM